MGDCAMSAALDFHSPGIDLSLMEPMPSRRVRRAGGAAPGGGPGLPMQLARDAAVRSPSRSLRTHSVEAGAQMLEEQDHERTQ